jgi:hypothetical protein
MSKIISLENEEVIDQSDYKSELEPELEQKLKDKIEQNEILKMITNFEYKIYSRIKLLEKYFELYKDETIEVICNLSGMYQFSGIKVLESFLIKICDKNTKLNSLIKLEALKGLFNYEEEEECINKKDEEEVKKILIESNNEIKQRNEYRQEICYDLLNNLCSELQDIPTPCKLDAIHMLMKSDKYKIEAKNYFIKIINDQLLECLYRYNVILSLEKKDEIINKNYFIYQSQLSFLNESKNMTVYRILSCQYLLIQTKIEIEKSIRNDIEQVLISFMNDTLLDTNLRADACDVILRIGNDENKKEAINMINILGRIGQENNVNTIFNNSQNVHIQEIDTSVCEIIESLAIFPLLKINGDEITITYVKNQIIEILEEKRKQIIKPKTTTKDCCYCYENKENNTNKIYCSDKCKVDIKNYNSIILSLNRIETDRMLYSKFSKTISNILLMIWTYINSNTNSEIEEESKNEMTKRLIEELIEMSGTCSSGFASRLINTISGYGVFNLRISWEDQIVANFSGRINAKVRKIDNPNSIYFVNEKETKELIKYYLNEQRINMENEKYKEDIYNEKNEKDEIQEIERKRKKLDIMVNEYFMSKEKVKEIIENFKENVINEMMLPSSNYENRRNFSKFFRDNMLFVREELYNEFREYITDTDFDLYFRKAIMNYENIRIM